MTFTKWIDRLVEEKGIDPEDVLEVEGPSGLNMIPVGCLVDALKNAHPREQKAIRAMIVRIDLVAPGPKPILDYFRHLAQAIAR
jgi:hypothetical protein